MSEEQFLSCLLRNSNLLKKIKEIEDSLKIDFGSFSDPFDVSYSYPSLFDIYSPETVAIQKSSRCKNHSTGKNILQNIAPYFENLDEHRKE